jgi:protein TorT
VWFPGPPGAGWSIASHQGCLSALEGSNIRILETNWGDTGKAIQLQLVEETLQNLASGPEPEFKYIVGTGTTIEAAVGALRARKLANKIKLVATYYTPGIDMFIKRGLISMAPSDQMISQATIAVDQAVRLLEGKKMATLGRPEFNDTGRITEHVQQQILIVTPDTSDEFNSSTTLAPKGWSPVFSVD